ncbi:YheV family putative metal-binding protein [Moraxella sp. ZY21109]|nr:YheV family putative zinc ribbon protein [Moraxella sp. ZY210820]WLF85141.1 YheV family putative metal-binding protein [Moraxella sp. ZY210820]
MMLKRRFIAGAKCPRCQTLDSIVMLTSVDDEWIECIDCQYSEQRPTEIEATTTIETDTVGVVQFKPMTVK